MITKYYFNYIDMFILKRFHQERFHRINGIIDSLAGHISNNINLIGSASLPFPEVCAISQLPATACRVEGFVGSRIFPDTFSIDDAELLVSERIHTLFSIDKTYEVNSQPHSPTQANQAIYNTVLKPGDKVMSISPADGGHISHSIGLSRTNTIIPFPMSKNGIEYAELERIANKERPQLIIAGSTSFPLEIDYKRLKNIADNYNGIVHADLAHSAPFIASKIHSPAFPYVDFATIDTSKALRGPKGGVLVYRNQYRNSIERSIFPLIQSSPNQGAIIAKACCLVCWKKKDLNEYAFKLRSNAILLSNILNDGIPKLVYGGTQSHLILLDLSGSGFTGFEAENACFKYKILVNRNQIPNDKNPHWIASGLRLSTTIPTILKYSSQDITLLGQQIKSILQDGEADMDIINSLILKYQGNIVTKQ